MKTGLLSLLRKSDFFINLEKTISNIKRSIRNQSNELRNIKEQNKLLATHIRILKEENIELKKRMIKLDDKLWDLSKENSVMIPNTEKKTIEKTWLSHADPDDL